MGPEEVEKKERVVLDLCICPGCPSWVECGEHGGFCFVTIGKSSCIEKERGCHCPGYPVYEKMNLNFDYYCIRGSEKEQSGM